MRKRRTGVEKALPPIVGDTYNTLRFGLSARGQVADEDVLELWHEYAERFAEESGDYLYDPRTFLGHWLSRGVDREAALNAALLSSRELREGRKFDEETIEAQAHEAGDDPRLQVD